MKMSSKETNIAAVEEAAPSEKPFYDYCEKCQETLDYFISKCASLSYKHRTSKELRHKYKLGYKKYLDKYNQLDFDYQELNANYEELKENYDKIKNRNYELDLYSYGNSQSTEKYKNEKEEAVNELDELKIKFSDLNVQHEALKQQLDGRSDGLEVKYVLNNMLHVVHDTSFELEESVIVENYKFATTNDVGQWLHEFDNLKFKNQKLVEEMYGLKASLDAALFKGVDSKLSIEKLTKELNELKAMNNDLIDKNGEFVQVKNSLETLSEEMSTLKMANNELVNKNGEYEAELKQITDKLVDFDANIEMNFHLIKENQDNQSLIDELKNKNLSIEEQLAKFADEIETLNKDKSLLEGELAELKSSCGENEISSVSLAALKDENTNLKKLNDDLNASIERYKQDNENLSNDTSQLLSKLHNLNEENAKLKNKEKENDEKSFDLMQQIGLLKNEISVHENETITNEYQELRIKYDQLLMEYDCLKHKLNDHHHEMEVKCVISNIVNAIHGDIQVEEQSCVTIEKITTENDDQSDEWKLNNEKLDDEIESLKSSLAHVIAENQELKVSLLEKLNELKEFEQPINNSNDDDDDNKELRHKFNENLAELELLREEYQLKLSRFNELKVNFENLEELNSKLKNKINEYEENSVNSAASIDRLDNYVYVLTEENASLKQQLEEKQIMFENFDIQYHKLQQESLSAVEECSSNRKEEMVDLNSQLNEFKEANNQLNEKLNILSSNLDEALVEKHELKMLIECLNDEVEHLTSLNSDLIQNKANIENELVDIESLKKEKSEVESELNRFKIENNKLAADYFEKSTKYSDNIAQIDEINDKVESKLSSIMEENARLKQQLDNIKTQYEVKTCVDNILSIVDNEESGDCNIEQLNLLESCYNREIKSKEEMKFIIECLVRKVEEFAAEKSELLTQINILENELEVKYLVNDLVDSVTNKVEDELCVTFEQLRSTTTEIDGQVEEVKLKNEQLIEENEVLKSQLLKENEESGCLIDELKNKNFSLEERLIKLMFDIEIINNDKSRLEDEMDRLRVSYGENEKLLKEEIERHKQDSENLSNDLSEALLKHHHLGEEKKAISNELETIKSKFRHLFIEHENLDQDQEMEVDYAVCSVDKASEQEEPWLSKEAKTAEIDEWKLKNEQLLGEIEKLKSSLNLDLAENQELKISLEKLNEEMSALKMANNELINKNGEYDAELKQITDKQVDFEANVQTNCHLIKENQENQSLIDELKNKNLSLEEQLAKLTTEIEVLNIDQSLLKGELAELKLSYEENKKSSDQVSCLKEQMVNLNAELDTLGNKKTTLEIELKSRDGEIEQLKQNNVDLNDSIETLKQDIENMSNALINLKHSSGENESLKNELKLKYDHLSTEYHQLIENEKSLKEMNEQLRHELDKKQSELDSLHTKYKNLEEESKGFILEFNKINNQRSEIDHDKFLFEQKFLELRVENENMSQTITRLNESLKILEEKNTTLLDDLSTIGNRNQAEIEELVEKKKSLEKEVMSLSTNFKNLNDLLYTREREINKLKDDLIRNEQESRELLKTFAKQVEDHEHRYRQQEEKTYVEQNELKQHLIELKTAYEQEKQQNAIQLGEISHLMELNSQFEKQMELKEQIIETKVVRITELNEQICNLTIKANDLAKDVEQLTKERSVKETDINELSIKLCDVHAENENLLKELLRSNTKINDLENKIQTLETCTKISTTAGLKISSTNLSESLMVKFDKFDRNYCGDDELQSKYDTLLDENGAKTKQIDDYKHENYKLKQQIKIERENMKKQAQKFEKEIAQLNKKIESMQKTNDYLTEQHEILNQQFFELNNNKENSNSSKSIEVLRENNSMNSSYLQQQQQQHTDYNKSRIHDENDEPVEDKENNTKGCAQQ